MFLLVLPSSWRRVDGWLLLLLSYKCIVIVSVLWLLFAVPWVGLQYVIVVSPDHTHLLFYGMTCLLLLKLGFFHTISYQDSNACVVI